MRQNLTKLLKDSINYAYVGNRKLCYDCKNMNKDGFCKLNKTPTYSLSVNANVCPAYSK